MAAVVAMGACAPPRAVTEPTVAVPSSPPSPAAPEASAARPGALAGAVRAGDGSAVAWQALRSIEHDAAPEAERCDWWTPLTPEFGTRPPDPYRWQCFVEAIRARRAATYATAASTSDHGAVMNLYVTDGTDTIIETDNRVSETGRPVARPEPARWMCRLDPAWTPPSANEPLQCSPASPPGRSAVRRWWSGRRG